MRHAILTLAGTLALVYNAIAAEEGDNLVDSVVNACQTEIDTYCSQVTPGKGRMIACFVAHEDKLSPSCEYALYQAASVVEQIGVAIEHVAAGCGADIQAHCSDVAPGEGRILSCLERNASAISSECHKALEDVGVKR